MIPFVMVDTKSIASAAKAVALGSSAPDDASADRAALDLPMPVMIPLVMVFVDVVLLFA